MPVGLPPNRRNISGSGFTNLQKMLQASRSNKLGQTVSTGIQQAGDASRRALQTAGQQFQQQVGNEQQRQANEAQRAERVLGDVSKASEEDINAFEGIRGGQSKGPTGVANADELRQQAQEAERLGKSTGSDVGRQGLLQRYVGGNRRYTGGQQSVDALLLGQTGADKLKQSRRGTFGLNQQAQAQQVGAQARGQELASGARGMAESTIKRLGGQATDFDAAMEAKRASEQTNLKARQDAIKAQLEAGEVDQDVLDKLGLNEGAQLWRANLADYYKPQDIIATRENVMNQDDFNKIQALRKLSGQSLTGDASKVISQYQDPTQVGGFGKMSPYEIEKEALAEKLGLESGQYHANVDPQEREKAEWKKRLYENSLTGDANTSLMANLKGQVAKSSADLQKAIEESAQAQGTDVFSKYGMINPTRYNLGAGGEYANIDSLKELAKAYNPNMTDDEAVALGKRLSGLYQRDPQTGALPGAPSYQLPENYLGAIKKQDENIKGFKDQYKFDRTLKRRTPV